MHLLVHTCVVSRYSTRRNAIQDDTESRCAVGEKLTASHEMVSCTPSLRSSKRGDATHGRCRGTTTRARSAVGSALQAVTVVYCVNQCRSTPGQDRRTHSAWLEDQASAEHGCDDIVSRSAKSSLYMWHSKPMWWAMHRSRRAHPSPCRSRRRNRQGKQSYSTWAVHVGYPEGARPHARAL